MIDYNEDLLEGEEDGPLFLFALADTQWKYGRLLPEVKEIAPNKKRYICNSPISKDYEYDDLVFEIEILD